MGRYKFNPFIGNFDLVGDDSSTVTANTINFGGEVSIDAVDELQINIQPVNYTISGVTYDIPGVSNEILDAGDATYDRIDAIVLTAAGVDKITGVPSATPVSPTIPGNYILLAYIDIPTLATSGSGASLPATVVYISSYGNDFTGQRGNADRPFKTIDVGKIYAQLGDEIWILPGVYEVAASMAKNGVTYRLFSATINSDFAGSPIGDGGTSGITYKVIGDRYSSINNLNAAGWIGYYTGTFSTVEIYDINLTCARNITNDVAVGSFRLQSAFSTLIMKRCSLTVINIPFVFHGNAGLLVNATIEDTFIEKTGTTGDSGGILIRPYATAIFRRCIFKGSSVSTFVNMAGREFGGLISVGASTVIESTCQLEDCSFIDSGTFGTIAVETGATLIFIGNNVIYTDSTAPAIWKASIVAAPANVNIKNIGSLYSNLDDAVEDVGGGDTITYQVGERIVDSNVIVLNN